MRDEVGLLSHRRGTVGISTRGRDTGDAQIFVNLVDLAAARSHLHRLRRGRRRHGRRRCDRRRRRDRARRGHPGNVLRSAIDAFVAAASRSVSVNATARTLDALRRRGIAVIDLTESNPTRVGFDYPATCWRRWPSPAALRYEPAAARAAGRARGGGGRIRAARPVACRPIASR